MTKPFYGQFLRQSQQIAASKSWAWLTTGGLKKEFGSLDFVWDNPDEPVPEETFTHSHLSNN